LIEKIVENISDAAEMLAQKDLLFLTGINGIFIAPVNRFHQKQRKEDKQYKKLINVN
jgi:hypothetical protein